MVSYKNGPDIQNILDKNVFQQVYNPTTQSIQTEYPRFQWLLTEFYLNFI